MIKQFCFKRFNKSFLFTPIKCQTFLFDPQIGPHQVLPFRVRVDQGVMAKLRVLRIPRSSRITGASPSDCLESYLGQSFMMVLSLCRDAVSVFYCPRRLGRKKKRKRKREQKEKKKREKSRRKKEKKKKKEKSKSICKKKKEGKK